uniref:Uncharacterized protein n=1 Tax=Anguilla anguilla TaxID=7936 RepID=A0A0E9QTT8_ANGAN
MSRINMAMMPLDQHQQTLSKDQRGDGVLDQQIYYGST